MAIHRTYEVRISDSRGVVYSHMVRSTTRIGAAREAAKYYDCAIGDRPVGNLGGTITVLVRQGPKATWSSFKVRGYMTPKYCAIPSGGNKDIPQDVVDTPLQSLLDGA